MTPAHGGSVDAPPPGLPRFLRASRLGPDATWVLLAAAVFLFVVDTGGGLVTAVLDVWQGSGPSLGLSHVRHWRVHGVLEPERLVAVALIIGALAGSAYRPRVAAVAGVLGTVVLLNADLWAFPLLLAAAPTCWAITRSERRTGGVVAVLVVAAALGLNGDAQTSWAAGVLTEPVGVADRLLLASAVVAGWLLGTRGPRPDPAATVPRGWAAAPWLPAGETAGVLLLVTALLVRGVTDVHFNVPDAFVAVDGTVELSVLQALDVLALTVLALSVASAALTVWRPIGAGVAALGCATVLTVLSLNYAHGRVPALALGAPLLAVWCAGRRDVRAGLAFAAATCALAGAGWLFSRSATQDDVPVAAVLPLLTLPVLVAVAAGLRTRRLVERARYEVLAAREAQVESQAVVTAERARIARELHDVVAHHVSLVAVRAETAPYTTDELSPQARTTFAEIAEGSRSALEELRTILHVLRREDGQAPELAPQPGIDDIDVLVEQGRAAGMVVRHAPLPAGVGVPPGVTLAAFKVVQEGLSNARRHAPRSAVDVRVAVQEGHLEVVVSNGPPPDGTSAPTLTPAGAPRPADVPAPEGGPGGFGLTGMRERVTALGGLLASGATAGGGWQVRARLPLAVPPSGSAARRAPMAVQVAPSDGAATGAAP